MQMLTEPPNALVQHTQVEEEHKPSSSTAKSKQTPEHILQERAAKSLSKSTTKKSSKPLPEIYHKILHVFIQVDELIISPHKVKGMIDSAIWTLDGMRWGDKEFHRSGMEYEYVLHFSHDEDFSVSDLQEKIEELEEYVVYTYVDDPDEDSRDYALWCYINGFTSATQPLDTGNA